MLDSKTMKKTKLAFLIYADFETILVTQDNGKKNRNESCTKKYQKHIAYCYGYKLTCVDDRFSKLFKLCLSEHAVSNFINSMIEENESEANRSHVMNCREVMKKHFNK